MNNTVEMIPPMYGIRQAAQAAGLAEYHIRRLVRERRIVYVLAGKKILVNMNSLVAYLEKGDGAE